MTTDNCEHGYPAAECVRCSPPEQGTYGGFYGQDYADPLAAEQLPELLGQAHATFRRWLGEEYDMDTLNAALATAAVDQLDGDPLWLLIISGPGNAKTETVQSLAGAGAMVTSTISSDGALLSGSPKRDRNKHSTGGLLRRIGEHGILVIKDVTSILSANRDMRATVLAALREVYDGLWERNLGTDGGRTLTWRGRIIVVGAVTTAWDRAHDVVSTMGDRFVSVRSDSSRGRLVSGRRSIGNKGRETQMRAELAGAVKAVLGNVDPDGTITLTDEETDVILRAADLVTLARTGVDYDYQGNVIDSHAPEMPTRLAKQLAQLMTGAVAVGISRGEALRLAVRCARDSMPPIRLSIIDDVAEHPASTVYQIRRRLDKPKTTVDRQCQSLHMLGVLTQGEQTRGQGTVWTYSLAEGIDPDALKMGPDKSPPMHRGIEVGSAERSPGTPADKSGPIDSPGMGGSVAKGVRDLDAVLSIDGSSQRGPDTCQCETPKARQAGEGRWSCGICGRLLTAA